MESPQGTSDVARMRWQIEQEYRAARSALEDFRFEAKHEFITAKMENIARICTELRGVVGDEAIAIVVNTLEAIQEETVQVTT